MPYGHPVPPSMFLYLFKTDAKTITCNTVLEIMQNNSV